MLRVSLVILLRHSSRVYWCGFPASTHDSRQNSQDLVDLIAGRIARQTKAYRREGLLNGKLNQSTVTITALEPPKRVAFDAEDSNSVFHHEFTFSPANGGTHVERHVTMTKGPFYFPLVLSIFKSTVQKNYNGAMSNLKTKMESRA